MCEYGFTSLVGLGLQLCFKRWALPGRTLQSVNSGLFLLYVGIDVLLLLSMLESEAYWCLMSNLSEVKCSVLLYIAMLLGDWRHLLQPPSLGSVGGSVGVPIVGASVCGRTLGDGDDDDAGTGFLCLM